MSEFTDRATGWRQDLENHSWLLQTQLPFDSKRFRAAKPPDQIEPSSHLRRKDQGQEGICHGASRSTAMEILNAIKTGEWIDLSMMYAAVTNQLVAGTFGQGPNVGATISDCVKAAIAKYGICSEQTFPSHPFREPTREALEEGGGHLTRSHCVFQGYDDFFQYLALRMGVGQVGIPVGEAFEECKGEYTLEMAQYDAKNAKGGHALCIGGYSLRKWLRLINSWGTRWGSDGTCEVQPEVFDFWGQLMSRGLVEMVGYSDLDAYENVSDRIDASRLYV